MNEAEQRWKTRPHSVVPVPKIARPKEPNHNGPVALTSLLMKRLILQHLRPLVSSALESLAVRLPAWHWCG